jgi:hypothetical protein
MAKANASSAEVDFGAIEEGGGSRLHVPEGDYRFKITGVTFQTSQSGNPMFVWTFKGSDGKVKGKETKDYTVLTVKALFKLRDLIEAATGKAPGGKVNVRKLLDYCKKNVVGKEIGITLVDDEYTNDKGKTFISSKPSDYVSVEDLGSEPPEDDEDVEDDDIEDEDDEDEDEDDGLDGLDRVGLKKHIKAEGLEVTVKKSMSDDDIRAAIRAASDDEDDDEEEIEDVDLDEL